MADTYAGLVSKIKKPGLITVERKEKNDTRFSDLFKCLRFAIDSKHKMQERYFKKMNKKIIFFAFIFLALISFVDATANFSYNAHGFTFGNSDTNANKFGLKIKPRENLYILNTTLYSGITCTNGYIYSFPDAHLEETTTTKIGSTLIFSGTKLLNKTSLYCLMCDYGGSTGARKYGTAAAVYKESIYFNESCFYTTSLIEDVGTSGYNLADIWTRIGAAPGTPPSLTLSTSIINNTEYIDYENIMVYFNGSSVNNSPFYDCTLYLDNAVQETKTNLNLSANQYFNLSSPINANGYYNLDINCSNENATDTNFYRIFFDTRNIYIKQFIIALSAEVETNQQYLEDLDEVLNMIGFIILWLGLWVFGYYAIQTRNDLLGGTMILLTLPIDFYFSYAWREALMLGTGLLGLVMGFMFFWTIGVFMLIKRNVGKFHSKA